MAACSQVMGCVLLDHPMDGRADTSSMLWSAPTRTVGGGKQGRALSNLIC